MFLPKISFPLRNLVDDIVRRESRHVGVLGKFLQSDTSHVTFSTLIQENKSDGQEDSTPHPINAGAPDKLYTKIEVEVRGNDPAVLKSYGQFAAMAANNLKINVGRNTAPYKAIHERWTVLKSAHVHKKHRVQYEFRTYYRYLDFMRLTGSTADTFLEYLQRNLPEGVAMKVTKIELERLPESVAAMCKKS